MGHGPMEIRFVPVTEGDVVEVPMKKVRSGWGGESYIDPQTNHLLGFKPGRAGKREGWLVYGVHTDDPKTQRIVKRRGKPAQP